MTDRPGTGAGGGADEGAPPAVPSTTAAPGPPPAAWPFAPGEASPAVQGVRPPNAEPDVRGARVRDDAPGGTPARTDRTPEAGAASPDAATAVEAGGPTGQGDPADGPDEGTVDADRLADYLDAGRSPYDPAIEEHPGNRAQLAALERLRALTGRLFDDDVAAERATAPSWLAGVLDQVRQEARTGREIPLAAVDLRSSLHVTEGAVRGLIREAGDGVHGSVVLSCRLHGDVTVPGEPVRVEVTISVLFGEPAQRVMDEVRGAVQASLAAQTELLVTSVDVRARDVHETGPDDEGSRP